MTNPVTRARALLASWQNARALTWRDAASERKEDVPRITVAPALLAELCDRIEALEAELKGTKP